MLDWKEQFLSLMTKKEPVEIHLPIDLRFYVDIHFLSTVPWTRCIGTPNSDPDPAARWSSNMDLKHWFILPGTRSRVKVFCVRYTSSRYQIAGTARVIPKFWLGSFCYQSYSKCSSVIFFLFLGHLRNDVNCKVMTMTELKMYRMWEDLYNALVFVTFFKEY